MGARREGEMERSGLEKICRRTEIMIGEIRRDCRERTRSKVNSSYNNTSIKVKVQK